MCAFKINSLVKGLICIPTQRMPSNSPNIEVFISVFLLQNSPSSEKILTNLDGQSRHFEMTITAYT